MTPPKRRIFSKRQQQICGSTAQLTHMKRVCLKRSGGGAKAVRIVGVAGATEQQFGVFAVAWSDGGVTVHSESSADSAAPLIAASEPFCFAECGPQSSLLFIARSKSDGNDLCAWRLLPNGVGAEQLPFSAALPFSAETPTALAAFGDAVAAVFGSQLCVFRASVTNSSSSSSVQLLSVGTAISLPEPCALLSVSVAAVWAAGAAGLYVVRLLHSGGKLTSAEAAAASIALPRVRKLAGLCCVCAVGTEDGNVFLAALRCCTADVAVARVRLAQPAACFDAFSSSLVVVDGSGRGLCFCCICEARSALLRMDSGGGCVGERSSSSSSNTEIAVDTKLATLVADAAVADVAILTPRSVALLCRRKSSTNGEDEEDDEERMLLFRW